MSWQRLASIVRKEVAQLLRDRRTLGSMISLPVIQLVLFGYLSSQVLHQPTVVWDQSSSAESRALIQAFENTRYFAVRYAARTLREVERRLDAGQARVGLVIPPDYARRVRAGTPAQVMVVVDASDATGAQVLMAVAGGVGASLSQDLAVRALAPQVLVTDELGSEADARAVLGLDEAIRRARLYARAGADVIFVEAPQSEDEMQRIAREVPAPLLINMFWGGKTPLVEPRRLEQWGYRIMIVPSDLQRAAIRAMQRAAQAIRRDGHTWSIRDELATFQEREQVVGLEEIQRLQERFLRAAPEA